MRQAIFTILSLALLAGCNNSTTTTPQSAGTTPSQGASSAPTTTTGTPAPALSQAARLTANGQVVTLGTSKPLILFTGGNLEIDNANAFQDGTWYVTINAKKQTSSTGLPDNFTGSDVDRVVMTVTKVVSGRASNDVWNKTFDVPDGIKLSLNHNGSALSGSIEASLTAAGANEGSQKGDLSVKYEFDGTISK